MVNQHLFMQLNIYETVEELIQLLAEYFVKLTSETALQNKRFAVALSGGNSPKKLYALLASNSYKNQIDWANIDFFFGDERYVPQTDAASNFKMINEVLFIPLNIPEKQIFPVNTALTPGDAANDYVVTLNSYFNSDTPQFDLILLGLGDNAHTASLFPYTSVLHETKPTIKAVFLEDQKVYRITLTAPFINLAHNIAFLVFGVDKAVAVKDVLQGKNDIENYPAQLIKPTAGKLVWFLDKEAASAIENAANNFH